MDRLTGWQRAITAIACAKAAIAIALAVWGIIFAQGLVEPWHLLMLAHVTAYAGAAVILFVGGRRDHRAVVLGVVMMLVASLFSDSVLGAFRPLSGGVLVPVRAIFALQVDAFLPFFLWLFAREFPRAAVSPVHARISGVMIIVTVSVGSLLISLNAVLRVATRFGASADMIGLLSFFGRTGTSGIYWPAQETLAVLAFIALVAKTKVAPLHERRRVYLLVGGLVGGAAPTVLRVLAITVSDTMLEMLPLRTAGWLLYPTLLSIPFTTAYAVLVQRALNVRLVVRRAVQYALARQTITVLVAVPFVILVLAVYQRRDLSLVNLLASRDGITLGALVVAGIVALRGGRAFLIRIDRHFFREQYETSEILRELVDRCRLANNSDELSTVLRAEIDRALHADFVTVLLLDRGEGIFASARSDIRPLDTNSPFAAMLAASNGAVDVDLDSPAGLSVSLPHADKTWLADCDARLAVPLKDGSSSLIGMLILGEKKSELPYSTEDRALLGTVAAAAALSLAYISSEPRRSSGDRHVGSAPPRDEFAAECAQCGTLMSPGISSCKKCGGDVIPARVPLVLAGKFMLEGRVGAGAMGVVYRARDIHLDREVAIKTLPHMSSDQAHWLRREAKAIAAVVHANLALIYGAESWHGVPMLVFEFLPGGTLADRLARGRLPIGETISLGLALSDVLGAIHRAGILHRDVKPTNVGLTAAHVPKLLDFGIARLTADPVARLPEDGIERVVARITGEFATRDSSAHLATPEGQMVGTPLYMSPEALNAEAPSPAFDIWSADVVLFEAIAGRHPVREPSLSKALRRIEACDFPDIREFVPSIDPAVSAFFQDAFARDKSRRPASADQHFSRLRRLAADLRIDNLAAPWRIEPDAPIV